MKKISAYTLGAILLLGASCSNEDVFNPEYREEGQILKSALDMSIPGQNVLVEAPTRAEYDINQFNVAFIRSGQSIATKSFLYGEMPDVVTLEAGEYRASVNYGEDREADWENPYFLGESSVFEVTPLEITSYIDPIECALSNIKVTIDFDPLLVMRMSEDSYVEVKVGDNNGLHFTLAEYKAGRAGYFRHTDETVLVATFHGTIDNSVVAETKSYSGIQKGRWYKLTFKLHDPEGGSGEGRAEGELFIDGSVNVEDINADVNIAEDDPLDDSERPKEGDEPNTPDDPPAADGPEIIPSPDATNLVFDEIWNVSDSDIIKFDVISHADDGIQKLTCDIISPDLTDEELSGFGLGSHLDIATTPEAQAEGLLGLGFPINQKGKKSVVFDISSFIPMLRAVGSGNLHQFKLYVKDANGECTKTLKLQF